MWDPLSGEHRSVLPQQYAHNSTAYNVAAAGSHMLVSLLYDHKHLLYDALSETPVAVFGQPADGLTYMAARSDNTKRFYLYSAPGGSLYSYEPGAAQPTRLVENLGQVALVREDRYAYVVDDQDFVYYDIVDRKPLFRRKLVEALDGMDVFAMTAGADGTIYGSTYINMHMFAVDQQDGRIQDLGKALRWGGQIDSMHGGRDGKIYLGSYVHAVVSVYDPSRPWQPGPGTDANPREYGPIGSGQYRTTSIALGPDGRIYIGSIPSYDSAPTGAFSRVDPRTGEVRTWLDVTPGGTVQHIVADDRYVYGAGGGRFFVWDPQTERAVVSIDLPTTAMVLAPGGEVVGCGGGRWHVFSPAKLEVIHTLENPLGDFTHLCRSPDGNLYGIHGGRIGRITPGSWTIHEAAGEGRKFLAADPTGRLYFARGSHVFRLLPPKAADRR